MDKQDWIFSLSTPVETNKNDPLRWRKQALYAGAKPVLADGSTREITEADIDTFVANGKARLSMGIKHPLPIGHTEDEEKNRGWVDQFEKSVDEKGRVSLYLGGTARDEEAIKTLKANDISIFAPKEDRVAGRVWTRSIKHAAITSYPRVKDLDAFELALSESTKDIPENIDSQDRPGHSFGDYLRKLRRHGMTSRDILKALERINPESLAESLMQIEVPENRFRGDDYEAIDGAAFQLAEENGKAFLARDGDHVLVLAEETEDTYRVVSS